MRLIAAMAVAVLALSVGLPAQNAAPPPSPATIATVNREPVTQADLDRVRSGSPDKLLGRALVNLIDERLVVQRAKNLGYEISDQQYQQILVNLKNQNNITSDEQLDAALTKNNMTRAQLRENLERGFLTSHVLGREVFEQLSFTDEDAQRYFDAHLDEFPLQTFELAKPDVIRRLKASMSPQERTARVEAYLRSLRSGATIVWTQPDLQQAYDQAAR